MLMGTITLVLQAKIRFAYISNHLAEVLFCLRLSRVLIIFVVQSFVFPDFIAWQSRLHSKPTV